MKILVIGNYAPSGAAFFLPLRLAAIEPVDGGAGIVLADNLEPVGANLGIVVKPEQDCGFHALSVRSAVRSAEFGDAPGAARGRRHQHQGEGNDEQLAPLLHHLQHRSQIVGPGIDKSLDEIDPPREQPK